MMAAFAAESWRAQRQAQNYAKAAKRAWAKVSSLEKDCCVFPVF